MFCFFVADVGLFLPTTGSTQEKHLVKLGRLPPLSGWREDEPAAGRLGVNVPRLRTNSRGFYNACKTRAARWPSRVLLSQEGSLSN